jgi:hypothetical protein
MAIIVTTISLGMGGAPDTVKSEKIHTNKVDEKVSCTPDYVAGIEAGLNLGKNPKKIRVDVECKELK